MRRWKADFTVLNREAIASAKSRSHLGPHCLAVTKGYMDPIGVQNQFRNGQLNHSFVASQVIAAVSFELWLRVFWGDEDFVPPGA